MGRSLAIIHVLDKNRLTTGSVVQMMEAAAGQRRRGHVVSVVSRPGGDLEAACDGAGVRFFPLPLRHEADLGSTLSLRREIQRQSADLIHVHKGRPHTIALLAAVGLGPRPVAVVNRGVTFPLGRLGGLKYRHPRVGAVVCVAEAVRRVVARTARVAAHRLYVIHAGTDCARFDPSRVDRRKVRRQVGVADEQIVVGQVSVRDWKGWRRLLEGFGRIAPNHPEARVLLVGCQPDAERVKVLRAASEIGIGELVLALPYRSDMPEVLAACDVVVDASWAGTGITGTIREAMAMERAVIATDCGGNRELVIDEHVGRLVPARSVPSLAAALDELLGNGSLRADLGRAARHRVRTAFSTTARLDRIEALYGSLVQARDNGHPRAHDEVI